MAASNVFMNWSGVTYSYGSGTPTVITIDQVKEVKVERKNKHEEWTADSSQYATVVVTPNKTRMVTIMGGNIAKLLSIPSDTSGTLTFTLNDAKNGNGSGAITFTLVGAILVDTPASGQHNKFAGGSVSFMGVSADGVTDPLTKAVAP